MTDAVWPVQQGIYDALVADTALMEAVTGVFDQVPEDAAMPYVVIGDATETPDDSHDRQGWQITVTLHIWSRYRGYREAAEILAAVDRALHRQPISVAGWHLVSIAHEFHQAMRDADPQVRHIPARYRVWLEEIREAG